MRFNQTRWIPEGSRAVTVPDVDAVAYVSERNGAFYAVAYAGKANKSAFNYRFRTEASRQAHIDNFFACRKSSAEYRAKKAAERKAFVPDLAVGDILRTCWGYDQTNVEFYEVTAAHGKHVIVRELCQERTETGYLSGQCAPVAGKYCGEPIRKLVCEGNTLKMADWGRYASLHSRANSTAPPKTSYWSAYA